MKGCLLILILFSLPAWALEKPTTDFFICNQKTATSVKVRSIRIHDFSEEKKCAVIYSVQGQDELLYYGRWKSFCKNKAQEVLDNLKKGLWECEAFPPVSVFYSAERT